MPKRRFKECWDQERVEREKAWRKARMQDKRAAKQQIRKALNDWQKED